jgi:hypothetical protein
MTADWANFSSACTVSSDVFFNEGNNKGVYMGISSSLIKPLKLVASPSTSTDVSDAKPGLIGSGLAVRTGGVMVFCLTGALLLLLLGALKASWNSRSNSSQEMMGFSSGDWCMVGDMREGRARRLMVQGSVDAVGRETLVGREIQMCRFDVSFILVSLRRKRCATQMPRVWWQDCTLADLRDRPVYRCSCFTHLSRIYSLPRRIRFSPASPCSCNTTC